MGHKLSPQRKARTSAFSRAGARCRRNAEGTWKVYATLELDEGQFGLGISKDCPCQETSPLDEKPL